MGVENITTLGIGGLTQVVNDHQNFLHDGYARILMEAIMWHDGEAKYSRERILKISEFQIS